MMRMWLGLWAWRLGFGFAFAQEVPDGVLKRLKSDPEAYLDLAADLIHGFGGVPGIDRAGIARFVALERAALRAGALRRVYLADLDFHNAVHRGAVAQLAAAASACGRGRLWRLLEAADRNGDGVVDQAEIAGFGQAEALRGFNAADEAGVVSVLAFDGNADGWVDLAEVKAAVLALGI